MTDYSSAREIPLGSEAELLVWCARTGITEDLVARIRQKLQEPLDWANFLQMTECHGVEPLVYASLSRAAADLVPAEVLMRLRRKAQVGGLLNHLLARELIKLCDEFALQGVPVIPIKGATLATVAYGDLGLRDFTDLDLLVPESSVSEAQAVLARLGYDRRDVVDEQGDEHDDGPHQVFVKRRTLCRVDLQWVMAHPHFAFRLDRPELWARQVSVAFENRMVPGLALEDLLIVLCVHGSKHAWEHLKWACDVAELLRSHPSLDWNAVMSRSSAWGCQRLVIMGLTIAHRLLDAPLPDGVLARVRSEVEIEVLSHRMPATLLEDGREGVWEEQSAALYFSLKDSWWERWRFGLRLCRLQSPVTVTPPTWFRWRNSLLRLARFVQPLHRMMKRFLSSGVRGAINRWVPHNA
ncbi:MAG: nucleotidyltransferase family protein [Nitrospira sp.]|nr:nucleotidyltransferase family protein [Nitrospira sp.]MDH4304676.1 nucleotidyltransferase family protein [Nitrospira sp.]